MNIDKRDIDVRTVFGQNLRFYRKNAGLSQENLAEKLNISQNHLGLIERGKQFVSYTLLEKIITVLDLKPTALFYTETYPGTDLSVIGGQEDVIKEELKKAYLRIRKRLHEL